MKHDDIRHTLSEYNDGAVSPKEKKAIESHLKSCTECRNALAELMKTIEHIKKVEELESPAWMTPKIMAKVLAEAELKRSLFQRLFYPLAIKLPIQTVAVLFLAVTTFYIYQNINPTDKYAEAPGVITPKKEPPAAGASMNEQKMKDDSSQTAKQAPQTPGYKSLNIKYMYEKPAVPAPVESKPSSAPATTTKQPASEKASAGKLKGFAAPSRASAPAEERDLLKEQEFSARAKKPEAASPYAGAMAKDEARVETPPSATKANAVSMGEKKEASISLSVIVKDTNAAGKEVEKVVAQFNGRIIKTESLNTRKVFIVKISSSKYNELVEQLKQVGEIKDKGLSSPAHAGDIDIRVELLKAPTQK
jgi:hypothetical protein